jgi:hypothetical protein
MERKTVQYIANGYAGIFLLVAVLGAVYSVVFVQGMLPLRSIDKAGFAGESIALLVIIVVHAGSGFMVWKRVPAMKWLVTLLVIDSLFLAPFSALIALIGINDYSLVATIVLFLFIVGIYLFGFNKDMKALFITPNPITPNEKSTKP